MTPLRIPVFSRLKEQEIPFSDVQQEQIEAGNQHNQCISTAHSVLHSDRGTSQLRAYCALTPGADACTHPHYADWPQFPSAHSTVLIVCFCFLSFFFLLYIYIYNLFLFFSEHFEIHETSTESMRMWREKTELTCMRGKRR